MKNKILYSIIALLALFTGCDKGSLDSYPVEQVFTGGKEKMEEISQRLKESSNGWNFEIINSTIVSQKLLTGFFKFENDQKFSFAADYKSNYANINSDNDYYLSSDKNLFKINFKKTKASGVSKYGEILMATLTDSIYTYNTQKADTLFFIGDRNGNILKLYPGTAQDNSYYQNGNFYNFIKAQEFLEYTKFFFNVELSNGKKFFYYKDEVNNDLIFHFKDANGVKFHKTKYEIKPTELVLATPFTIDGQLISSFSSYRFENEKFVFDGGAIQNENRPIDYVSGLADFMRINSSETEFGLWKSNLGWNKRKLIDVYGLKGWRSDYQIIFRYRNGNNSNFHRIGTAYFPGWYWWNGDYRVTSREQDGKVYFTYLSLQSAQASQAYVQMLQDTNLQEITAADGLYVIKTIDNQIVLVNAGNAESWIFYR